ncbi:MAG: 50S ribosomal protein L6, partial [archaeon]
LVIEMTTIEIPKDVKIEINNGDLSVQGKLGTVNKQVAIDSTEIKKDNGTITINPKTNRRKAKAMAGTITSHIKNMIKGVCEGWEYELKILYLHFPMTVKVEKDRVLVNNFLGENTPRIADVVGDTKVEVEGDKITVTGIDIETVSRTASNIELATRIKRYDRRVFQDGIFIVKKG